MTHETDELATWRRLIAEARIQFGEEIYAQALALADTELPELHAEAADWLAEIGSVIGDLLGPPPEEVLDGSRKLTELEISWLATALAVKTVFEVGAVHGMVVQERELSSLVAEQILKGAGQSAEGKQN